MAELKMAMPLLPGKAEMWRRFCQELNGRRLSQYEVSRRMFGVSRESAWLISLPHSEIAIVSIHAKDLPTVLQNLALSQQPFDRWFRRHLWEICGLDMNCFQTCLNRELVFHWSKKKS